MILHIAANVVLAGAIAGDVDLPAVTPVEGVIELDPRIEFVSDLIDADPEGAGVAWRPDPDHPDVEAYHRARARFSSLVQERRRWLGERRKAIDRVVGHRVVHVKTRHFTFSSDLDGVDVDGSRVNALDLALTYASRLEDYREHVVRKLRVDEARVLDPGHEVVLLREPRAADEVSVGLIGGHIGGGYRNARIGGAESILIVWDHPALMTDDRARHQILIHLVAHHIYNVVGPYKHWLHDDHGWLFEGLAFHDEIELFGPPKTTCEVRDVSDVIHWQSPYWEANVYRAIRRGRAPDPARVFQPSAAELNMKDRQFAWSYIDFLLWRSPAGVVELLEKTKGELASTPEALSAAFGLDLASFEKEWRAFVLDRYSRKPRKGPTARSQRGP